MLSICNYFTNIRIYPNMSAFDAAHSHENFYSNLVKKYTDLIILNLKYIQQIKKKE